MSKKSMVSFDDELLNHIRNHRNAQASSMLNKDLAQIKDNVGTLLHYAVEARNTVIVKKLVDLGANINSLNYTGCTPLMLAYKTGFFPYINPCSKVLLEMNASIDGISIGGEHVLKMAIESLYHKNADRDEIDIIVCRLKAETQTTEELASRLIAAGYNMYHAAILGDINLAKCMLNRGIDINSNGINERTALHVVGETSNLSFAKWLIKNGANVNAVNGDGKGVLLTAVINGNSKDLIKILLEHGADPNNRGLLINTNAFTNPLFAAFSKKYQESDKILELVELLLNYGAIPNTPALRDFTIFDLALERTADKGVQMLICHLAMLEMRGRSDTKSDMYFEEEENESKQFELEKNYELCQQVLKVIVFEKLSLFCLLQADEKKMLQLVRKETFITDIEKVCLEHKLKESYLYYYNILTKSIAKARRVLKLEKEAILALCKLCRHSYNQCYTFARKVVDYLEVSDLENLIEV